MAKKNKARTLQTRRALQKRTRPKTAGTSSNKARKVKRRPAHIPSDERFETALKYLREGRTQKRAAEIGMVSVKRFRRFLHEHRLAKRKGNRWVITDRRKREVAGIFQTGPGVIEVRGFSAASLTMRHRAAVQAFATSNDIDLLTPFDGLTVTDTGKQTHILETRPNVLLRLLNAGSDAGMKIYRLID